MQTEDSFAVPTRMKSLRSWLGYWWISWFGILGGFFMVGVGAYNDQSTTARHLSLALMAFIGLCWIVFFVADSKAKGERRKRVVDLLTLMGTLLALFTLFGIGFLVFLAP